MVKTETCDICTVAETCHDTMCLCESADAALLGNLNSVKNMK